MTQPTLDPGNLELQNLCIVVSKYIQFDNLPYLKSLGPVPPCSIPEFSVTGKLQYRS